MALKTLKRHNIIQAVSFPSIIDIVVYRDEEGAFYTLKAILDSKCKTFKEAWLMAVMMGEFAPERITGEVEFETNNYMGIRMDDGVLYRFAYGLPRCWIISDELGKH